MVTTLDHSDANFFKIAGPSTPSNDTIAVMGSTETGQWSFIRRPTGDESIEIGHGVESVTSEIGQYNHFNAGGRSVTLPGFDDSREGVTDTDILRKITALLEFKAGSELATEMRKLLEKHNIERANLKKEMEEAIAAKDEEWKKELDAERTKMQHEITKWEEKGRALADGLAAVREEQRRELADGLATVREEQGRALADGLAAVREEQRRALADGLGAVRQDMGRLEEAARKLSETPPRGIWDRFGGIRDFIRTLYQNILDRDPEGPGALEWHTNNTYTHGLANTVGGFFMSPEYMSRGLSTEATVDKYYLSLLGRQPEAQGKAHWVGEIQQGMTLWEVANGFVGSDEYRRRIDAQMAPHPVHWP